MRCKDTVSTGGSCRTVKGTVTVMWSTILSLPRKECMCAGGAAYLSAKSAPSTGRSMRSLTEGASSTLPDSFQIGSTSSFHDEPRCGLGTVIILLHDRCLLLQHRQKQICYPHHFQYCNPRFFLLHCGQRSCTFCAHGVTRLPKEVQIVHCLSLEPRLLAAAPR